MQFFNGVSEEKCKCCIFCNMTNHESANCRKASKFSYDERKRIISENKCCFKCIKPFHRAEKCRTKISCQLCGKNHSILMCLSLAKHNDGNERNKDSKKK